MITFPDPILEVAVREAIGIPTGDIRYEDVSVLESLVAFYGVSHNDPPPPPLDFMTGPIRDLSGIQCLRELETLVLDGNEITDIGPLAGLAGLWYLSLDYNSITDLSLLSDLPGLGHLRLRYNNMSDLTPLVANMSLAMGKEVWLEGNPIDCTAQADNIQALRDRGVWVATDCPYP